jgi:hypothetical protein
MSRIVIGILIYHRHKPIKTTWPESASELYRPSDRRLSAKLVPTFADRMCHVVSVTRHKAINSINLLGS